MSKIQEVLMKATGVEAKRNEDRQAFLGRLVLATAEMTEEAWNKLERPAQEWFNGAADAKNAKKELPEFSDLNGGGEAETSVRRRGTSVATAGETKAAEAPTAPAAADPDVKVGDHILLTDARGNEYEGDVVEKDASEIVIKVDGTDEAFRMSKVKSIKVLGKAQAPAEVPAAAAKEAAAPAAASGTRTGRTAAATPAAASKPAATPGAKPVTQRMREVICANRETPKEKILEMLKAEKLEFRDSTFDIMFSDTQKTIQTLKAVGALK